MSLAASLALSNPLRQLLTIAGNLESLGPAGEAASTLLHRARLAEYATLAPWIPVAERVPVTSATPFASPAVQQLSDFLRSTPAEFVLDPTTRQLRAILPVPGTRAPGHLPVEYTRQELRKALQLRGLDPVFDTLVALASYQTPTTSVRLGSPKPPPEAIRGLTRDLPPELLREATTALFGADVPSPAAVPNLRQAFMSRLQTLARYQAQREVLGDFHQLLSDTLSALPASSREFGRELASLALGEDTARQSAAAARVAATILAAESALKLPLAAIQNSTQPLWGIPRTSLRTFLRSVVELATDPAARREFWQMAAAPYWSREHLLELTTSQPAGWAQRMLGLLGPYNATERFVAFLSLKQGQVWARELAERLATARTPAELDFLRREFRRLHFTPEEIDTFVATRTLPPDAARQVMWATADQIAFFPARERMIAAAARTPWARLWLQFKGFGVSLSRMLAHTVLEELRHGNAAPAARLLGLLGLGGQTVGELVNDLRATISGRERPAVGSVGALVRPQADAAWAWRALENASTLGGLGILSQLLVDALESGQLGGAASLVLGPAGGDVLQLAERLAAIPSNPERGAYTLARWLLRAGVPVAGPAFTGYVMPPANQPPIRQAFTVADRLGLTPKSRVIQEAARLRRESRQERANPRLPWRRWLPGGTPWP